MSDETLSYRTLIKAVEQVVFKERKSKFIGYAYPVRTEQDIKKHLHLLKQLYPDANHICYAWKLGVKAPTYRAQDDGEPRNSAGMPIYGQIKSMDLTNIAVFVVRYFGGVKLGVGGLISAYRSTAANTLAVAEIQERFISSQFRLEFDYEQMNAVQRMISRLQLDISERILEERAFFTVDVPLKEKARFLDAVNRLYKVKVEELAEY